MNTTTDIPPDFAIEAGNSVWLIRPLSESCHDWLREHTDGMWFQEALAVEPRYVEDLVYALEDNGFTLQRWD